MKKEVTFNEAARKVARRRKPPDREKVLKCLRRIRELAGTADKKEGKNDF